MHRQPVQKGTYARAITGLKRAVHPHACLALQYTGLLYLSPSPSFPAQAYYFRTNYIILCSLCYAIGFLRNPLALAGLVLTAIAVLSTNDSFATRWGGCRQGMS